MWLEQLSRLQCLNAPLETDRLVRRATLSRLRELHRLAGHLTVQHAEGGVHCAMDRIQP